jgi:hypothetical protein
MAFGASSPASVGPDDDEGDEELEGELLGVVDLLLLLDVGLLEPDVEPRPLSPGAVGLELLLQARGNADTAAASTKPRILNVLPIVNLQPL